MTDLLPYLPDDADAARPEDLARRQQAPPQPMVLGDERAWPGEDPTAAPFHYIGLPLLPAEFRDYCKQYNFGSAPPSYWVWHHTYNPDASWAPISSNQSTWWDRNEAGMSVDQKKAKRKPQLDSIMRYYRESKGWKVGPHLFIDDLFIWLFTPMYYIGIHCNEGNSYKKGSTTRYSIGCEVIGYYDHYTWSPAIYAMAGWACACVKACLGYSNVYTSAGQDRPDLHDPQLSGHRDYTTEKTCPGLKITNSYFTEAATQGWAAYQANTPPGPLPPDPLKAKQIAGPSGATFFCSIGTYDFYMQKVGKRDGLWDFGYALADEYKTTDSLGNACQIMPFERGILKTSAAEGARPTLLSEAIAKGWVK